MQFVDFLERYREYFKLPDNDAIKDEERLLNLLADNKLSYKSGPDKYHNFM